jgi:hypothetical protein
MDQLPVDSALAEPQGDSPSLSTKRTRAWTPEQRNTLLTVVSLIIAIASVLVSLQTAGLARDANQVQERLARLEETRETAKFEITDVLAVTVGVTDGSQPEQSQILLRVENRGGHASAIHSIRVWATQPEGNRVGLLGPTYDSSVLVFNFTKDAEWPGPKFSRSIESGEQAFVGIFLSSFVGATKLTIELEPVLGDTVTREEAAPFGPRFKVNFRVPIGYPCAWTRRRGTRGARRRRR